MAKKKSVAIVGVDRPEVGSILKADAVNRGLRAFFVSLAIEVFIQVWPLVSDVLQGSDPINLPNLGMSVLRVALYTAGQYVMRRFLDPSKIPTPLPPD